MLLKLSYLQGKRSKTQHEILLYLCLPVTLTQISTGDVLHWLKVAAAATVAQSSPTSHITAFTPTLSHHQILFLSLPNCKLTQPLPMGLFTKFQLHDTMLKPNRFVLIFVFLVFSRWLFNYLQGF